MCSCVCEREGAREKSEITLDHLPADRYGLNVACLHSSSFTFAILTKEPIHTRPLLLRTERKGQKRKADEDDGVSEAEKALLLPEPAVPTLPHDLGVPTLPNIDAPVSISNLPAGLAPEPPLPGHLHASLAAHLPPQAPPHAHPHPHPQAPHVTVGVPVTTVAVNVPQAPGVVSSNPPPAEPAHPQAPVLHGHLGVGVVPQPLGQGLGVVHPHMAPMVADAGVSTIHNLWHVTAKVKEEYEQHGITWNSGRWTQKEKDILLKNIEDYQKTHNMSDKDLEDLVFPQLSGRQQRNSEGQREFYKTIAQGLNRPIFYIYRQVLRMKDPANYKGKFTKEESDKLLRMHAEMGNKWKVIGEALGRSPNSVRDHFRILQKKVSSGPWQPIEEERLTEVVLQTTGTKLGEDISSGVPWQNVADQLGTRNAHQCRHKWYSELNWKLQLKARNQPEVWQDSDDVFLIQCVLQQGVEDTSEIEWNSICEAFQYNPRSSYFLQARLRVLMARVSNYQHMPLTQVLEELQNSRKGSKKARLMEEGEEDFPKK